MIRNKRPIPPSSTTRWQHVEPSGASQQNAPQNRCIRPAKIGPTRQRFPRIQKTFMQNNHSPSVLARSAHRKTTRAAYQRSPCKIFSKSRRRKTHQRSTGGRQPSQPTKHPAKSPKSERSTLVAAPQQPATTAHRTSQRAVRNIVDWRTAPHQFLRGEKCESGEKW